MTPHPIKLWLLHAAMKQKEFAHKAIVPDSYLSQILNKHVVPGLDVARRLSNATGGEVHVLDIMDPQRYKDGKEV